MKPENKFFKEGEIKKDLLVNPPSKWLSMAEVLSEKFTFKINDGICQLVDCVGNEYESFVHDKEKKEFLIKIPPTLEYNYIFFDDGRLEVQKFLVHLLRKKIISNLHLPLSMRFFKKIVQGQSMVSIESRLKHYTENSGALADAMLKPKEFNREIISFKVANWSAFLRIKKRIKNSKRYKEYLKNKELGDLEKKNRKFEILNIEEIEEKKPQQLYFDDAKSILSFAGKDITISKNAESDAHDLLKIIFNNRAGIWNNDEILDNWQFNHTKSKIPKNKIYQAGKAVNRIVAQETTIKDFLDITTKTIAINKKYLNG